MFIPFLGLGSITIPLAIILFIFYTKKKKNRVYTTLNISLFIFSLCATFFKLFLTVINRYKHGRIIGNAFAIYPYYALVGAILISIVGIVGWQHVVKFIVFLYHLQTEVKL